MSLLATIKPLLANGSEFTFIVTGNGDGLRVVTLPKLKQFQPDTTDAELAALQAALVQPLVFNITADAADPDATLAALLNQAAGIRQTTVDRLEAYQDAQRQAQQQANAEAAKKASAAKKPVTGKTPPAKDTKAGSETAGSGTLASLGGAATTEDGEDGEEGEGANAASEHRATAPQPTVGIDLFGGDNA